MKYKSNIFNCNRADYAIVEGNGELIRIYAEKVKNVIKRLWEW